MTKMHSAFAPKICGAIVRDVHTESPETKHVLSTH